MKNLNHLTCLLSMLALVSIQEPLSAETWDQKLDLTIPSLEMPSTLPLDLKAKHEIMLGWTCCYQNSLVQQVRQEHLQKSIALQLKESQNQSQYTLVEPIDPYRITTFVILQAADVYYTRRSLRYDCVRELNPIIGPQPTTTKMVATKIAILVPAYRYDYNRGNLSNRGFDRMNILMALVIANNYNVEKKAKKYCQLK